jgi:hypothetical protein
MKVGNLFYLLTFSLFIGCKEPYPPPVTDNEATYLVVDGLANITSGIAQVKLSRAVALSSTQKSTPELFASLSMEDDDGRIFPLNEVGNGLYTQSNLFIDQKKLYRLNIKTENNHEYTSDFVAIKETPIIDSLNWAISAKEDGVEILVNTHDDKKIARFYQWDFEETYEYEAAFLSNLRIENGAVVLIPNNETTFKCWKTIPSQKILIASSSRLTEDVISNFPITLIPKGSQKTYMKYSILVKQRVLSEQAYNYWLNLQKTTESLGGLFDAQPGQVKSNIRSKTNSNEPILGYFDIGSVKEKRLFINNNELPEDLRNYQLDGSCNKSEILVADLPKFDSKFNALVGVHQMGTIIIGYFYSTVSCTDCRLQEGVSTPPPFWQ